MTSEIKCRLLLAILCGVGFTALVALSLNIPSGIVLVLSLFLAPGSLLSAMLLHTQYFGEPLIVLAFDACLYSFITYVTLRRFRIGSQKERLAALTIVGPVLLVASMACIPAMSPLWPRGMLRLAEEEKSLKGGLPVGTSLDSARAFLVAQKVQTYDYEVRAEEPVLENAHARIVAKPGDQLVSARIETEAEQFPCGYVIQVALVFGPDRSLRERYIERSAVCP